MGTFARWKKQFFPGDPLRGLDRQDWLQQVRAADPVAIALLHPDWRGVASSARNLFPVSLAIDDIVTPNNAPEIANLLLDSGCRRLVIHSFPLSYIHLIDALHRMDRSVEIFAVWYSSFLQASERYGWRSFRAVKELTAHGHIRKLGFAKAGMAEVMNRMGIPAGLVLSTVPKIPAGPSLPNEGGPHLGLYAVRLAIWRKLPYAMLAATTAIPGAVVHVSGADQRVEDFVRELDIQAEVRRRPIPQEEIGAALARMHVNLYVTLSECCPMLPLESLSEGAPCLIGPNSHLFEEDQYLFDRLVVPFPDRNDVIGWYIERAIDERDEIIAAYRRYVRSYNERSQEALHEFLGLARQRRLLAA
jgi:hypothetical protein